MRTCFAVLALSLAPIAAFAGPVNINTADAQTLAAELDGVGMSRAQAIVEYRDANGAFSSPEEVLKVKGIGPQVLEANRGNILTGRESSP